MSAAVQWVDPAAEEDGVIARALEILTRRHARGKPLTNPAATRAYLRLWLAERPCEIFGAIFLDTKNRGSRMRGAFHRHYRLGASVSPRRGPAGPPA